MATAEAQPLMENNTASSPPPPIPTEPYSLEKALQRLDQFNPLIQQALHQANDYQRTLQEAFDSAIAASRSRLSVIRSTSSAHFQLTLGYVEDLKQQYAAYEDKFFAHAKEGALVAASHPFVTAGTAVGLGCLLLKGPRSYLYYRTLRLFSSEEALLSRADAKVKQLRQSFESLKAETEKLEKHASSAEQEMKRATTKLRDAGVLIRKAAYSTHKIEKQALGLKDILGDLPRREASKYRSQISNIVSEAKRERKVLSNEVTKISNYGISV